MQMKKYLVSNNSEGSICITGRNRIDIPGMCVDIEIELPENTARQTVSRLKQRYPLLKISEVKGAISGEEKTAATAPVFTPQNRNETPQNGEKAENAPADKAGTSANGEKAATSDPQADQSAKKNK